MASLGGRQCRLIFYLVLCLMNALLSVVTGVLQNCVALVADSFAQFAGVISLAIGLVAIRLSARPPNARYTYGYQRADLVGALANAAFLCGLCFGVALKAIGHFVMPDQIDRPDIVLYVGVVGLCVNLIGVALTVQYSVGCNCKKQQSEPKNTTEMAATGATQTVDVPVESVHVHGEEEEEEEAKRSKSTSGMKAVLLTVICDALGSVVVIVVAVVEIVAEGKWTLVVDPLLTLLSVAAILIQTIFLLRELMFSLMDGTPKHISVELLASQLTTIEGVVSVHELHVRQLHSDVMIATVHLITEVGADASSIQRATKRIFHDNEVHSTTVQLENRGIANPVGNSTATCSIPCVSGAMCRSKSCCSINFDFAPLRESPSAQFSLDRFSSELTTVNGSEVTLNAAVR